MALSISEMAAKGRKKLQIKTDVMKANYDGAKGRMKANFRDLPFGPNTTRAYEAGIDAAEYRLPDLAKWERNWTEAVQR